MAAKQLTVKYSSLTVDVRRDGWLKVDVYKVKNVSTKIGVRILLSV